MIVMGVAHKQERAELQEVEIYIMYAGTLQDPVMDDITGCDVICCLNFFFLFSFKLLPRPCKYTLLKNLVDSSYSTLYCHDTTEELARSIPLNSLLLQIDLPVEQGFIGTNPAIIWKHLKHKK